MPRIKSDGQCNLCGKSFNKQAMSRHLLACVGQPQAASSSRQSKLRAAPILHLFAQGAGAPEYWLHLEAPADATLADLDGFLRDIWLECCGHLSAFTIEKIKYNSTGEVWDLESRKAFWEGPFDFGSDEIDEDEHCFNKHLGELLKPEMKFEYEYDFGSTTELTLKVLAERESRVKGHEIQILARNNPPTIPCESCRENSATQICTECQWSDAGWLCDSCAKRHRSHEEMLLPVVNSPRAGVCGYEG